MRKKHKPNAHISCEQAGLVEWGVLVTRAEVLKLLPFGLAGGAHVEGGWFDRILWAEKHAGHIHRRSQSGGPVFETRTKAWMPLSGGIDFSELNLIRQRIKVVSELPQGERKGPTYGTSTPV